MPLSRWRARGTLGEIRAADLRFTPDEARQFLTGVMGLGLAEEDSAALETYTEGWIAGLQLAALALRQQEAARIHDLISGSVASHRYVLDYLSVEALQALDPEVQSFLRQTAILDQLCAAALQRCDRAFGQPGRAGLPSSVRSSLSCLLTSKGSGIAIIIPLRRSCRSC